MKILTYTTSRWYFWWKGSKDVQNYLHYSELYRFFWVLWLIFRFISTYCTLLLLVWKHLHGTQFLQALPVFTFANQAGLDMLETTLVALQDITLEKIFDDHGRKILCSEFPQIIQQVYHLFLFSYFSPCPLKIELAPFSSFIVLLSNWLVFILFW